MQVRDSLVHWAFGKKTNHDIDGGSIIRKSE